MSGTAGKIKVGMVLDILFPPDDRPEKEAISLIEAGFEVHLLCPQKTGFPLEETYKGIYVHRFKIKNSLRKKLSSAYLVLPFYRWIWKKQVKRMVTKQNIDILHVHDLPLCDIGWDIARKYGLKLVCDQHEYWSNWIGTTAHYNTLTGKIVKIFSNWKAFEKKYLQKADLVITVTEPLREAYINEVGIQSSKVITIPNTPALRYFQLKNIDQNIVKQFENQFVIFYAGVMSVTRGIELIIKALPELEKEIPNIRFVVAGRISRNCDPVYLAQREGVSHLVKFLGWLDIEELPSYMAASKISVFTPTNLENDEINKTIATKVYQYAAMHLPIIVSKAKMMQAFVEKNELGFAVDVENTVDFIRTVKMIYADYEKIKSQVSKNSEKLFKKTNVFWEDTVTEMTNRYNNMREMIG
ncbi:MAG: glycosyltransferase, partial [Caldithrix sp.]|nr:glycosyltransferase [Caldithrix sp.]